MSAVSTVVPIQSEKMDIKLETITPTKAQQYLNRNKSNRKLREGVAEKYAHDMKTGNWTMCAAPIWFYDNGDVADGQHRLWAIVEADTPQKFYVGRGLSRDAGLNIDTGVSRTLVDNARISGLDTGLSNELVGVARAVHEGERQNKALSNAQRLEMINKHREAATWACQHGPRGRNIRNQCTLAAVARAWYHEADREKLMRFCHVLSTGHCEGESESSAVSLRNYLLTTKDHRRFQFRETFLKSMNAISYFMKGKKLMVIKTVKDEAYPLPRKAR